MMKYTAGELANMLGITARTVRFYDEKKILLPCAYSEKGYRLYDENSARRLQKILMLRFLDFSIEQIQDCMKEAKMDRNFDVKQSLKDQEHLLLEKKDHIERILKAVSNARNASDDQLWEQMRKIVQMTKERETIVMQYKNEENLNKRLSIHQYSTSKLGYYPWMLSKLNLAQGMKILEIGCGNAAFWKSIAESLPTDLEIHLTDYSAGMLESAEKTATEIQAAYPEKGLKFFFEKRDATDFSYPVSGFDRIMANHVLFYIAKEYRQTLYEKILLLLAPNGRFSCSLIGKNHNQELHQLLREYYPNIDIPSDSFDFWLENAGEEIDPYFSKVKTMEQKNDLLVPDEKAVYDYVRSYSEEADTILRSDRERFLDLVRKQMTQDGCMYIHKSTGIIICDK